MGPSAFNISDQESETANIRRGRPPAAPDGILQAADRLFAETEAPFTVTMDMIAAAAGVGKGTLFRAFGSRDGLLDTLWAAKLGPVRAATEGQAPPLGTAAPAKDRLPAFLDALLSFKLANRHLIRAREIAPQLLQSSHYKWMHGLLSGLFEEAAPGTPAEHARYLAHALLAALHLDLIEELLADGLSLDAIRERQAAHARAVVDDAVREAADPLRHDP